MMQRRDFIKLGLATAGLVALPRANAANSGPDWLHGVIYTESNLGMWEGKQGGHLPQVKVEADKITLTTDHVMTKQHYIVRHSLVAADGRVLAAKTFYPQDEAVSIFDRPAESGDFYATSFCNKHDLWATKFSL